MKVVINTCYGGFGLSDDAFEQYLKLKGTKYFRYSDEGSLRRPYDVFYSVPKAEYNRVYAECMLKGNYHESNKLYLTDLYIQRNDPVLVQVVEEMGEKANGRFANLSIVEIPDDVQFEIEENDGWEHVSEVHRTWGKEWLLQK